MIIKVLRDWNGHKENAIVELGLQDGRRAVQIGVASEASMDDVKRHLKAVEKPPKNKVVRLSGYKQKTKKVASRRKKKKPAGKRSK